MIIFHTSIPVHLICLGNSTATMLVTPCFLETTIQPHQSLSLEHTGLKVGKLSGPFWRVELLRRTRLLPKLQGSSLRWRMWINSQRKVFPLLVKYNFTVGKDKIAC
uniref:Uncharacterized protein n=1 Tax=Lotus japonicus TaxID=34305 RepID=I3RZG6_LOTJA|nr:unknown [Lotus japonicus]